MNFFNIKKLSFGLSEKKDGPMNLRESDGCPNNRKNFFLKNEVNNIILADLVHGNHVSDIRKITSGVVKNTDALITNLKNVALCVTVGDCLPLFFYDNYSSVIGIAHAGWRGVLKNIAGQTISVMEKKYNSDLEKIKVYVGPHIKECHFEVKEDIVREFKNYPNAIIFKKNKIFINLGFIVKEQLKAKGIKSKNIKISEECTFCENKFFSYRRDKPKRVMSQLAYIYLK